MTRFLNSLDFATTSRALLLNYSDDAKPGKLHQRDLSSCHEEEELPLVLLFLFMFFFGVAPHILRLGNGGQGVGQPGDRLLQGP